MLSCPYRLRPANSPTDDIVQTNTLHETERLVGEVSRIQGIGGANVVRRRYHLATTIYHAIREQPSVRTEQPLRRQQHGSALLRELFATDFQLRRTIIRAIVAFPKGFQRRRDGGSSLFEALVSLSSRTIIG